MGLREEGESGKVERKTGMCPVRMNFKELKQNT